MQAGGQVESQGVHADCTQAVCPGLEQGHMRGLPQALGQLAGLPHEHVCGDD